MHATTGVAGISLLSLGGADVPALMSAVGDSAVGPVAKVLFAFPLIYHYGSALRHFVSQRVCGHCWLGAAGSVGRVLDRSDRCRAPAPPYRVVVTFIIRI